MCAKQVVLKLLEFKLDFRKTDLMIDARVVLS